MKCRCGFRLATVNDFVEHKKVHMRQHIPAKNFMWWLGETLDSFITRLEYIDGLDGIEVMDNVLYLSYQTLDAYQQLYAVYLKGTCKNQPCIDCIAKNIIRTMPEKKYMKYKMEKDGIYEPQKPRVIVNTL